MRTILRERLHNTSPRLGRHVLHDSESRRYTFNTAGLAIRSVRHQRHIPIFDQGDIGDCTGNAAIGCLGTGPFYSTLPTPRPWYKNLDERDAIACYSAASRIDDAPGEYPPTDTGSSGLAVAKVVKLAGLISGYQHTFTLEDALKALQVVPLICGTVWLSGMDEANTQGLVSVTGQDLGGHEYVMDEYDDQRGWVGFSNSWGTSYGVNGRFYMQAEDFGTLLARDGDVTVFTPLNQPAPQPSPAPLLTADDALAASLHRWLDTRPQSYRQVQVDARKWLTTKGL